MSDEGDPTSPLVSCDAVTRQGAQRGSATRQADTLTDTLDVTSVLTKCPVDRSVWVRATEPQSMKLEIPPCDRTRST